MSYILNTYLLICAITGIISFAINYRNRNLIVLTSIIMLDIFIPIPINNWYWNCILVEISVFLSTFLLSGYTSKIIRFLSVQMIVLHICGNVFNGNKYNSPYGILAKLTEYSEILSCVLLSNPIINIIKRKMKCHLLKS